jgi:hypothetical protein
MNGQSSEFSRSSGAKLYHRDEHHERY